MTTKNNKAAHKAAKAGNNNETRKLARFIEQDSWKAHGRLGIVVTALQDAPASFKPTLLLIERARKAAVNGQHDLAVKQLENVFAGLKSHNLLHVECKFRVERHGPNVEDAVQILSDALDRHISGEQEDHELVQAVAELLEKDDVTEEDVFELLTEQELRRCRKVVVSVTAETRTVAQAIARSQRDLQRCADNAARIAEMTEQAEERKVA